jgi:hypothetical protein
VGKQGEQRRWAKKASKQVTNKGSKQLSQVVVWVQARRENTVSKKVAGDE